MNVFKLMAILVVDKIFTLVTKLWMSYSFPSTLIYVALHEELQGNFNFSDTLQIIIIKISYISKDLFLNSS